jgi:catechol 2,3-dioxygenase-like lactoylglutathione lyase family enzyme
LYRHALENARLQQAVSFLDASPYYGTLIMLEHINLNVGCAKQARAFYFEGLGFAEDPRAKMIVDRGGSSCPDLVWGNIGLNQVHMPVEDPVQVIRGTIYATYTPAAFDRVHTQLQGIKARLDGTRFDCREEAKGALGVTCPFGNRYVITKAQPTLHKFIGHPGGTSLGEGINSIVFTVGAGAAHGIARFYHAIFGAQAYIEASPTGLQCVVPVGLCQHLTFREHAPGGSIAEYDGHHICVYTSDLELVYHKLQELGLVWNNPRFVPLGLRYDTLEMAQKVNEVRFLDITDPATGEALFRLEHEIRTKQHPNFPCQRK